MEKLKNYLNDFENLINEFTEKNWIQLKKEIVNNLIYYILVAFCSM